MSLFAVIGWGGREGLAVNAVGQLALFLATLAALCALGWGFRSLFQRVRVPAPLSLIALGALLGPSVLDLLPEAWLGARSALSQAAFVVLLLRAGLALPVGRLRQVLWPALLLGTLPVAAELVGFSALARFGLFDRVDVAILSGFLIAAVSPAVVLPIMLDQKDLGRGATRLVPDRIIVQTVINVLIAQTGILLLVDSICPPPGWRGVGPSLALLPLSVAGGVAVGVGASQIFRAEATFRQVSVQPTLGRVRGIAALTLGLALAVYALSGLLGLESVFATLALGVALRRRVERYEKALRADLRHVWRVAEIVLFVNLGSAIELGKLTSPGFVLATFVTLAAALGLRLAVARWLGARTGLSGGELGYSTLAHIPKATIQAVFGAYPLTIFLERCSHLPGLVDDGQTLVVMAVLAIVATAPPGVLLLERRAGPDLSPESEARDGPA